MKSKLLSVCLLACLSSLAALAAKPGLQLQVNVPDLGGDKAYLGHYYMGKLYQKDSIQLDSKGKGAFTSPENLPEGLYVVYFSGSKYFDVLLSEDQHISVQVDTANMSDGLKFSGAEQTVAFYEYSQFLRQMQKESSALSERLKATEDEKEKEALTAESKRLNERVQARQNELRTRYEGKMMAVFLNGLLHPDLPEFEIPEGVSNPDSLKTALRYGFFRDHYFDYVDFADERVYRTPYIRSSLDFYVNKVLVQQHDSIAKPAIRLIERSKADEHCFQNMANYFLDFSVKSHIMGMDNLLVELGYRYYLNGQATWADSTLVSNISKEIRKIEHSLVGMQAPNISLCDTLGRYHPIYDLAGEQITILFFFEPTCGHCKKTTPLVREFYEEYKNDPRLNVIAVYMLDDEKEWRDFIKEYQTESFINVWDPERSSYYWSYYDTSTTPMIYVFDANHKIFAKKVDVEGLKMIAKYELK
ncbi:MAG: redoxin domain-containing protein [Paludibacteraceae bacterium]|nr:redoxin domain-containing protein [Paludibacteraceae bacterium]